ncbi:MAG: hypothetical protein ACR2PQ_02510, partial [Myxococcota bacterium]
SWGDGSVHAFDYDNDVQKEVGALYQKYTYFSSSPSLSGPRPVDYYEFISGGVECADGMDNDGDGAADHPADIGCDSPSDVDEHSPLLPCDDGVDNDGDFLADYPADPGCWAVWSVAEDPACDDGVDNDGDTLIDLDDPQCNGMSAGLREKVRSCGLGFELALVLPVLLTLRRRLRIQPHAG